MWRLFVRQLVLPRLKDTCPPGYAELAEVMGFRDARSAANAVRTVVRKFQSHMKHCIGDYLPVNSLSESESGVNEEFHEIMSLLSRPGSLDPSMFDDLVNDCIGEHAQSGDNSSPSIVGFNSEASFFSAPETTLYATDKDIGFRWHQFRESSIAIWLESFGTNIDGAMDATFESLACGEFASEEFIVAIRNTAKRAAREPEDEPVVLLGLIYLLAIAVGFKHHKRIFSSDSVSKIRSRMSQLIELAWLDERSRSTLRFFVEAEIAD